MSCPSIYHEKEYLLVFPLNQSIVRTVTGCDHQVKQTARGIYRPENPDILEIFHGTLHSLSLGNRR